MDGSVVKVERVISAPPPAIFALLTDPAKHQLIDGSGRIVEPMDKGVEKLRAGSLFTMSMRFGLPYTTVNEVVEFDEDRRIAWCTRPPGLFAKLDGGRTWRYELEPVGGGTRVTETWDPSTDRLGWLLKTCGLPARTRSGMENTLQRIADLLRSSD
jgi:uncharacterized protein YndB with AHSA1/START domain